MVKAPCAVAAAAAGSGHEAEGFERLGRFAMTAVAVVDRKPFTSMRSLIGGVSTGSLGPPQQARAFRLSGCFRAAPALPGAPALVEPASNAPTLRSTRAADSSVRREHPAQRELFRHTIARNSSVSIA